MTRTSLVDGIIPFCFTCSDNIRLVCGKRKEPMALRAATTGNTPAKRPRHPPGYYRALHNCSSADVLGVATGDRNREHGKLRLRGADRDLPEGCYEVERLVAKRRRKVIATVIFMCLCVQ